MSENHSNPDVHSDHSSTSDHSEVPAACTLTAEVMAGGTIYTDEARPETDQPFTVESVLEAVTPTRLSGEEQHNDAVLKSRQAQLRAQKRVATILGQWPVHRALLAMSGPAFVSMVAIGIYQVVDASFVSKFAGETALASMTLASPLEIVLTGLYLAPAVGGATTFASYLGRRDYANARYVMGNIITISLMLIALILALTAAGPSLLLLLGASNADGTYGPARDYLLTISLGCECLIFSFCVNNMFRASGRVDMSCVTVIVQAILNGALDPAWMLLFGLWGYEHRIIGAALSTVFSYFVAMLIGFVYFLVLKRGPVTVGKRHLRPVKEIFASIFGIGAATACVQVASALMSLAVNTAANTMTDTSYPAPKKVAVVGSLIRTVNLATSIIISGCQGLNPLVAFCHGAKARRRMRNSFLVAIAFMLPLSLVLIGLLEAIAEPIGRMFSSDADFIRLFAMLLRYTIPMLFPYAACHLTTPLYQATGHNLVAAWLISTPQLFPAAGALIWCSLDSSVESIGKGLLVGAYIAGIIGMGVVFVTRRFINLQSNSQLPEDPVLEVPHTDEGQKTAPKDEVKIDEVVEALQDAVNADNN